MNELHDPLDLVMEDPIAEAFPVMVDAAERLCRHSANGDDCYIYHRFRPYFRLAATETKPLGSRAPIVHALRQMARESDLKRVLISGSADYASLALVVHACRAEGIEPDVTVLDLCEAPLYVNRWYAERVNASVRTVACDACDFKTETPFDAIVTDNFLHRIPPKIRPRLIQTWHRAIRAGGVVVTKEPVYRDDPSADRPLTDAEFEAKIASRIRRLQSFASSIPISQGELEEYVRTYDALEVSHPFTSLDEIQYLFESNGFAIQRLHKAPRRRRADHPRSKTRRSHVIVAASTDVVYG